MREREKPEPAGWWLANRYPEVCRAHADFGGSDQLEDWLRKYHAAVLAERRPVSPAKEGSPDAEI